MLLRLDIPPFLSGRLLHSFIQLSRFHAAVPLAATHYDLLSLPHSATRAEIKKYGISQSPLRSATCLEKTLVNTMEIGDSTS